MAREEREVVSNTFIRLCVYCIDGIDQVGQRVLASYVLRTNPTATSKNKLKNKESKRLGEIFDSQRKAERKMIQEEELLRRYI